MQWHEDWGGIGNVHDMRRGTRYHGGWFNGDRYIEGDFRRGFVESITCSWSDWTRHANAIRAATPILRVRLSSMPSGEIRPNEHDTVYESWPGEYTANWKEICERRWKGISFELPPFTSGLVTADIGQITSAVPQIGR
jgi:hypothetical protein